MFLKKKKTLKYLLHLWTTTKLRLPLDRMTIMTWCTARNYIPSPSGAPKYTLPHFRHNFRDCWASELAQRKATKLLSEECTHGFMFALRMLLIPWTCSVLTMLISPLRDVVKWFLSPLVLVAARFLARWHKIAVARRGKVRYIPWYAECGLIYFSVHHISFRHPFLGSALLTRMNVPEHFVVLKNMDEILLTCHIRL